MHLLKSSKAIMSQRATTLTEGSEKPAYNLRDMNKTQSIMAMRIYKIHKKRE